MGRAMPVLPLCAFIACYRVKFTLFYLLWAKCRGFHAKRGGIYNNRCALSRAVESESEGILGGVGVGRNFRWSRSRKEF
jgi:hypothetical protein